MLSPGRGLRGATARDMIRQPDNLGWKIKATLKTAQALHHIETVFEGEPTRKVFIDDMPVAQTRLAQLIPIIWLTPPMDRLWQEGSEGTAEVPRSPNAQPDSRAWRLFADV